MLKIFVFALVAVYFTDGAARIRENAERPAERPRVILPKIHAIVGQSLEIHPQDLIPENLQGLAIAGVKLNSEQAGVIFQAADAVNVDIKATSAVIEAIFGTSEIWFQGNDITITGTSAKMPGKKEGDVIVAGNHYELAGRGNEVVFDGANLVVVGDAITVEGTSYQEMAEYLRVWGSELHLREAQLKMSTPGFKISQINDSPAEMQIPINFSGITTGRWFAVCNGTLFTVGKISASQNEQRSMEEEGLEEQFTE